MQDCMQYCLCMSLTVSPTLVLQGECLVCGTYNEVMEMVERSDEDSRCAAVKSVLSEMIAHMSTEAEKDVFNVEDSMEDLREGCEEEGDGQLSPNMVEGSSLLVEQNREETKDAGTHTNTHTHTHTHTHTVRTASGRETPFA